MILCTGFQHIPVGPLTPQLEQLAVIASQGESSKPEATSSSSSSVSGKAGHVKAFSGRGHTLSSGPTQSAGLQLQQDDPLLHAARLLQQKTTDALREQESRLQQEVRHQSKWVW